MKTIKRENKIPKDVALAYGVSRKFRIAMRRAVSRAAKLFSPLEAVGSFTPADPKDVRDVRVFLDRIARDLSQQNWGK